MFERLTEIHWDKLRHCLGKAYNIPDLIKKLCHPNKRARKSAYKELYACLLYSESYTCAASSYVIPFLYEILENKEYEDKLDIMKLILNLALRKPEDFLPFGFERDKYFPSFSDYKKKSYISAAEDIGIFTMYLSSEDERIRKFVLYALSFFPIYLKENDIAAVKNIAEDSSAPSDERAEAMICLAIIGREIKKYPGGSKFIDDFNNIFLKIYSSYNDNILKISAATGLIVMNGFAENKKLIPYLINSEIIKIGIPYFDSDDFSYMQAVLMSDSNDTVLEETIKIFKKADFDRSYELTYDILALISKEHKKPPYRFSDFSPVQQKALKYIGKYGVWSLDDKEDEEYADIFYGFGFPSSHDDFMRFIKEDYDADLIEFFNVRELAESGDAISQKKMGEFYEDGGVVELDYNEAVQWYELAADNMINRPELSGEYSLCMYSAGYIYHFYLYNYKAALRCYKASDLAGCNMAANDIGIIYEFGRGVDADIFEAMKYYEKSALMGNIVAQNNLGLSYEKIQDYENAFKWYLAAAKKGETDALNNVGRMYYDGLWVDKDYQQAFKWYSKAVRKGNIYAMNNVGHMYEFGEGLDINYDKAFKYYKKSASKGCADAQNNMGRMYFNGNVNGEKDYKKAVYWYKKAAKNNNVFAMDNLAWCYRFGLGVRVDYDKALDWYHAAASRDSDSAMNDIASMYYDGSGVERCYETALIWYRRSADLGNAYAMNNIGYMYETGQGVEKNYEKAIEYYKKSAEKGCAYALNNIGRMYYNGRGVPQNHKEAMSWYKRSAEKDCDVAMYNLGYMYEHGEGTGEDVSIAKKYYLSAAELNNSLAMYRLANILRDDEDLNSALYWYRKSAELGNHSSQNLLGKIYEHGESVDRDEKEAVKWYKMSADDNDPDGLAGLAWMYFNGKGVLEDYKEAARLYRLAGDNGYEEGYIRACEIEKLL